MYTNLFDTVKTRGEDILSVQNMLYTSIISGLHPTFALNQAVDNMALIALCQSHSEIIDLIDRNVIRVAPYKVFYDERNRPIDPIMGYLRDALNFPEEGSAGKPYIFSSLPFLNDPDMPDSQGVYDEKARRWIYLRMREVVSGNLRYFSSNLNVDRYCPKMQPEHIDQIDQHLRTVRKIMDAAKGQYLPLRKSSPEDNALSNKVQHYTKLYSDAYHGRAEAESVRIEGPFVDALVDLEARMGYGSEAGANIDDRSALYGMIGDMQCQKKLAEEIRGFVDICYNEVVAESLYDNEQDIIVLNHDQSNIELMVRHDDPDCMASGQKLMMVEKADSSTGELSWEKLASILAEVRARHPEEKDWKVRMEEALRAHELRHMKVAGKKYVTGIVKLAKSCLDFRGSVLEIVEKVVKNPFGAGCDLFLAGGDLREGGAEAKKILEEAAGQKQDMIDYQNMKSLVAQINYLKQDYAQEDRTS